MLKIEYVDINSIRPYENNAKEHPREQIEQIKKSIQEFGNNDPIAVWNNEIVEGHGRYEALKELEETTIPIIRLDNLTDEQRKAYTLVHNKLTMNSDFDFDLLNTELDSIIDINMEDFGFDIKIEMNDIAEEKQVIEDEIPEIKKEAITKMGDIYKLGNHRLMCGDSTSEEDVTKLMNGERADITFTSPPYNTLQTKGGGFTNIGGKKSQYYSLEESVYKGELEQKDDLSDEQYTELLIKSMDNALKNSDEAMYNIGILAGSKRGISNLMYQFKDKLCDILVWNKSNNIPLGLPSNVHQVGHRCELIFCFNQTGNRNFTHSQWKVGTQINRIDTPNASGNEYAKQHGATFPVELPFNIIKDYTETSCLDFFGGTGTTMIACEQLNRKCYMMELDPLYCDLIIERWEKFTGEKAVKLN